MLSAREPWRRAGARQLSTIATAIRTAKSASNRENSLIPALRKVYGQSFAAGYPETEKLREVLLKLNENLYAASLAPDDTRHLDLVAAI